MFSYGECTDACYLGYSFGIIAINDVLQYFMQQGVGVNEFHEILPSLNDIFIKLVEGTALSRQFQQVEPVA